jgi:hypothetical protein
MTLLMCFQARALVEQLAPGALAEMPDALFQLRLQRFLEMLRAARTPVDQVAAIRYARAELDNHGASSPKAQSTVRVRDLPHPFLACIRQAHVPLLCTPFH